MTRKTAASLLIFALLAAPAALAGGHEQGASDPGKRTARVAGGETVELAASAKSSEQWAKERPDYQALMPKKR